MLGYYDRNDITELISVFAKSQIHASGFMCKRNLVNKPHRKSCYKVTIGGFLLYVECKRKNISLTNADNLVNYFLKRDVFYSLDKAITCIDKQGVPKGFGHMKILKL